MKPDSRKRCWIEITSVIALSVILLLFFYGEVLIAPNLYLFSTSGDGLKNYFGFIYHIYYDSGIAHLSGANYPYGDLLMFADGNPLLAGIISLLSTIFPGIKQYSIGIYNYSMIIAFLPAAVFSYLSLKHLRVSAFYAIAGGILITFLAPQWHRITGHLSLSYVYIFPVLIFLSLKFYSTASQKIRWTYTALIALITIISIFSHVYLGTMAAFFILAFGAFMIIFNKPLSWKKLVPHIAIQALISIVLLKIYLLIFDTATGRPEFPGSETYTGLSSLLLPYAGPTKAFLEQIFVFPGQVWEGVAYIGLISSFILIFGSYRLIRKIKNKRVKLISRDTNPVVPLLATAILSLIVALGFFHTIFGNNLFEIIREIKQLRVVARFGWIFYYCILTLSFYSIYKADRYFRMKNMKLTANTMAVLIVAFFYLEGYYIHRSNHERIIQSPNYFAENPQDPLNDATALLSEQTDLSSFQAIIGLPFFYVGAEYFGKHSTPQAETCTQVVSFRSGLPMTNAMLARSPVPQAKNILSLLAPPYFNKGIKNDLNEKPFLVLHKSGEPVNKYEQRILDSGRLIFSSEAYNAYEVPVNSFLDKQSFRDSLTARVTDFYNKKGFLVNDTAESFFFEDFKDSDFTDIQISPGGSFRTENLYHSIYELPAKSLKKGQPYELSFWYYNAFPEQKQFVLVEQVMQDGSKEGWDNIHSLAESFEINGKWSRVEKQFTVREEAVRIKIVVANSLDNPLIIDDLLIKPTTLDVAFKENGDLKFYNNHRFTEGEVAPLALPSKNELEFSELAPVSFSPATHAELWENSEKMDSPGKVQTLKKDDLYSTTFNARFESLNIDQISEVRLKGDIEILEGKREHIYAIFAIVNDDSTRFSRHSRLSDAQSNSFTFDITVPVNVTENDRVRYYIHNTREGVVKISDLEISFATR